MLRYISRLTIAAMISTVGVMATFILFGPEETTQTYEDKKPIARLAEALNEVQRKPIERVIWEGVTIDDPLFAGEAIRTTSESEAKIEFLDTGTIIELEPDSLVILEASHGKVALDFLKGNLFVKAGQGGAGQLTLKSGTSNIDLANAELALGKGADDQLNLEVFKGQATVDSNGKKLTLDKNKSGVLGKDGVQTTKASIQITLPEPNSSVYINPKRKELVNFNWKPLEKGYVVSVEAGKARSKLRKIHNVEGVGENGKMTANLKIGRVYWRLVATHPDPKKPMMTSPIVRNEIVAKLSPVLLEPNEEERVVLESREQTLSVKWANPARLSDLVLEVSQKADLKKLVAKEVIRAAGPVELPTVKKSGTYYMRLTGFLLNNNRKEPVSSDVRMFHLKVGVDLVPPILLTPLDRERVPYEKLTEEGLMLSWKPVPGIKEYQVVIQPWKKRKKKSAKNSTVVKDVHSPQFLIKNLKPGRYAWRVRSKDMNGKYSKDSKVRGFAILSIPKLLWADKSNSGTYYYVTKTPSLGGSWTRGPEDTVQWRVRYTKEGGSLASAAWQTVKETKWMTGVDNDGIYEVEVEAVDAKGLTLARSAVRSVSVQKRPLLSGPKFAKSIPPQVKAKRNGSAYVKWDGVKGAQSYVVEIKDEDGEIIKEYEAKSTQSTLRRLLPGEYSLSVKSVDQYGRRGPAGEEKDLVVPNESDVKAPKIKTINVR
jgi:hypothetical protein